MSTVFFVILHLYPSPFCPSRRDVFGRRLGGGGVRERRIGRAEMVVVPDRFPSARIGVKEKYCGTNICFAGGRTRYIYVLCFSCRVFSFSLMFFACVLLLPSSFLLLSLMYYAPRIVVLLVVFALLRFLSFFFCLSPFFSSCIFGPCYSRRGSPTETV